MDDEKATATEQELFELSEKDIYKFTQSSQLMQDKASPTNAVHDAHIC